MGADFCKSGPGYQAENALTSDIYLSHPSSLVKTQIRRSGSALNDLRSSFVGPDTSLLLGCK